jgi:solute carrier family 25 S-adenosylmethionine transporter 26
MISKAATVEEGGFISGLVSGAVSRASKEIILHPIDTVRARLQTSPDLSLLPKRVLADSDEVTVTNENLFDDLYSGLTPALIGGIPAGALFFGVKDYTKKKFRKMGLGKAEATLLSVLMANFPYWVVRTPSEVLKTRQQTDNSEDATSMMAMIRSDLAQKGLANATSSIYDSYIPNIAYAFPADAVKFLVCKYTLSTCMYSSHELLAAFKINPLLSTAFHII